MLRIEDRKLQRIDHADGIDDAAGREPSKPARGRLWKIGTKAEVHF